MNTAPNDTKSELPPLDLRELGEAFSFWFAISSPLTGVIVGFLGAWFYTWLTT